MEMDGFVIFKKKKKSNAPAWDVRTFDGQKRRPKKQKKHKFGKSPGLSKAMNK